MHIGLIGKKRSGKDTLAAELVSRFGYTKIAFADKILDFALALDPIIGYDSRSKSGIIRLSEVIDRIGYEQAKEVSEVRRTLQRLGTEAGRQVLGENIWVDTAMARVSTDLCVFTDVRFPNEAKAIESHNGLLVRILRPGLADDIHALHASETSLDDYPVTETVVNDGGLEEFQKQAERIADLAGIR